MDKNKDEDNANLKCFQWKFFLRQLFHCGAIVLNYFVFGLYLGAPTVIIPQLMKEANSTRILTLEMVSWISSVSLWSTIPWVFILPMLAYRYGRKLCLVLISFNVLLGNILFYRSASATELLISLALQGMLVASMLTVGIMVTTEYTAPRYRGILMTCKSATLYWGVWLSNIIGTFYSWRNIGIVIFICGIYNLTTVFFKESPYWLATRGRFAECADVHRWLKGADEDAEEELRKLVTSQQERLMKKSERQNSKKYFKVFGILTRRTFYKPLLYAAMPIFLYVLSGKVACTVYAIDILKRITSSERTAYEVMLLVDGVTVLGMYAGCALSKILTRRKQMLIFSSAGIGFLYILSIYLYMIQFNIIVENNYASIFFLIGFSISISCGTMILTPCCTAELSPLTDRSYFLCCLSLFKNVLLAITLKTTPLLFQFCGTPGAFLIFAISSSLTIFILFKYLPETKDQTIQEIEELITRGKRNDINTFKYETVLLKDS